MVISHREKTQQMHHTWVAKKTIFKMPVHSTHWRGVLSIVTNRMTHTAHHRITALLIKLTEHTTLNWTLHHPLNMSQYLQILSTMLKLTRALSNANVPYLPHTPKQYQCQFRHLRLLQLKNNMTTQHMACQAPTTIP